MTREIKFRAWDKSEKKMYYNVQNSYDTIMGGAWCGDVSPKDKWRSFGEVLQDDKLAVMQWTGLKDKNGKDIYEGDILSWNEPHRLITRATVQLCDDPVCFLVAYFQLGASTAPFKEVVGNVYENPDLIKDA